jgi:hypothetical protein
MGHDSFVQPGIFCPEHKIIQERLVNIYGGDPAIRTEPGKGKGLHAGSAPDIKNFSPFAIRWDA